MNREEEEGVNEIRASLLNIRQYGQYAVREY